MKYELQKNNIDYEQVISLSKSDIGALVRSSEDGLMEQLRRVADEIMTKSDEIDVILLAGPSCSGKTTFSQMLADTLEQNGVETSIISMDNFYMDRDKTPFLDDGVTRDYESLRCFDMEQIRECFSGLKANGEQMFPIFDFINGKNLPNSIKLTWKRPQKIIIEGLHSHNPEIIEKLGFDKVYKLFVCANSDFVMNNQTVITAEQLRFMRRLTRDKASRGNDEYATYTSWPHVLAGESTYINQYKFCADFVVDTVHAYEVCLYKYYSGAVLGKMDYSGEALYLHHVMREIQPYSKTIIPEFSLMWEFIKV